MIARRNLISTALLGSLALAACNSLTGADGLHVADKGSGGSSSGSDSSGAGGRQSTSDGSSGTTTGPSGSGSTSTSTSTSGMTTSSTSSSSGGPVGADATGVTIAEIAAYQTVKTDIMKGGAPKNGTPIVANKDCFVRVFVQTDGSYKGEPVTAHLVINGGQELTDSHPAANSSDANTGSTFNFQVPAAQLTAGAKFNVALTVDAASSAGPNPGAHYPASGDANMNVVSTGSQLKIVLVPVAYQADGSGRTPDTSAGAVQQYKDRFLAIYPAPAIDIQVHAPFTWNQTVDAGGNGWDTLLNGITDLRNQDGAASDVYYYGAFDPASSFAGYCGGGCVAGLGWIGDAGDPSNHAAIGLGWSDVAAETATHEIGHNHGRQHAPCGGASGIDPSYPYSGADIGEWGYDSRSKQLIAPNSGTTDMMGYCNPTWVSDYTYAALFTRVKQVNGASIIVSPDEMDRTYSRVGVDSKGNVKFFPAAKMHTPPMGQTRQIVVDTPNGQVNATGHFYKYDHLDGGVIYWRDDNAEASGVTIDFGGGNVVHAIK